MALLALSAILLTGCLTTVSAASQPLPESAAAAAAGDYAAAPEGFYISERLVYEYDETGFRTKRSTFNKKGNLTEYELYEKDESGRRIRENEFRPAGELKNYKVFEFNDAENTVIKKYFSTDDKIYRYIVSAYDSTGNLLKETDYRIIE